MEKSRGIVLSASRRTDLVGCYPDILEQRLQEFPPAVVHSLVIWTKNPRNMIRGPLPDILRPYRQLYVHLTITGMGGGEFEPAIPAWPEAVEMIGPLIALVGSPKRISWRFDPILEARREGREFSNLGMFPELCKAIAFHGIQDCRISWVSPYPKVIRRLAKRNWHWVESAPETRGEQARKILEVARDYRMRIHFCSMEGFPISRCIDGERLGAMHPEGLSCSTERAKGQRDLCGCTASQDIGWYSLRCRHGCLYCYATP